jgi:hypothetical protein
VLGKAQDLRYNTVMALSQAHKQAISRGLKKYYIRLRKERIRIHGRWFVNRYWPSKNHK